jgi:uncharacterized membrane protein
MKHRISIETASSWVLRGGVVTSMVVMLAGLARAFLGGGVTVGEMEHRSFVTSFAPMLHGVARLDSFSLMELGVLLLVLTPILRVLTSMVLFAVEEHDGLYTSVTFLVLLMTVGSLLLIR